jgi:hypothetical protein
MIIPYFLLVSLLSLFLTFTFLCAGLKVRDAKERGDLKDAPKLVWAFCYVIILLFLVFDFVLNFFVSVITLDAYHPTQPSELLTTGHISRLKKTGNRWQKSVANWLCNQINRFDKDHC